MDGWMNEWLYEVLGMIPLFTIHFLLITSNNISIHFLRPKLTGNFPVKTFLILHVPLPLYKAP